MKQQVKETIIDQNSKVIYQFKKQKCIKTTNLQKEQKIMNELMKLKVKETAN
jgi:hypothetical protein